MSEACNTLGRYTKCIQVLTVIFRFNYKFNNSVHTDMSSQKTSNKPLLTQRANTYLLSLSIFVQDKCTFILGTLKATQRYAHLCHSLNAPNIVFMCNSTKNSHLF